MAGLGISQLRLSVQQYRPDLFTERADRDVRIETEANAESEDLLRARMLRVAGNAEFQQIEKSEVWRLADNLERSVSDGLLHSKPSSSCFMRERRIHFGGALWQLKYKAPNLPQAMITIIPASWEILADDLMLFDPASALNRIRNMLNRRGAKTANGYLVVVIHGEYDAVTKTWRIHVHGIAAGEMINVVDQLRYSQKLRNGGELTAGQNGSALRPVQIKRSLTNLPDPYTYCMQSFWPQRSYSIVDNGEKARGRRKRLPEPYHSLKLLWLERHRLEDLTLLMGIRATADGFKLTR